MHSTKAFEHFYKEVTLLKFLGISLTKNKSVLYTIYSICILTVTTVLHPILVIREIYVQGFQNYIDYVVYEFAYIVAKTVVAYQNRIKFGKILRKLHEHPFLPNVDRGGEKEQKLMEACKWTTNAQTIVYWSTALGTITLTIIFTVIMRIANNDYNKWVQTYGPLTVLNTTYSPNYEISQFYQNFTVLYSTAIFTTIDLLIAAVLCHVSFQFKILQNYIQKLVSTNEDPNSNLSIPWKVLRKSQTKFIEYHNAILDIGKEMEDVFSPIADSVLRTIAKTVVAYQNRIKFGKILRKLHEHPFLPNVDRGGEKEQKLMEACKWTTNAQTIVYWSTALGTITLTIIFTVIMRIANNDYNKWVQTYGPLTVLNTTYSPNYEISQFYQNFTVLYSTAIFTTIDLLIAAVLCHVSFQFKILQNYIRKLISTNEKDPDSNLSIPWKVLRKSQTKFIEYHNAILDIGKEMEDVFSPLLLIVYLGTIGVLCFETYRGSMATNSVQIIRTLFEILSFLSQIAIVSYWGEQIIFESQSVASAAFGMNFIGTDLRMDIEQVTNYVLPLDVATKLRCSACKRYLSCGPIRMKDDKYICGRCKTKQGEIHKQSLFENVMAQFKFPCNFDKKGCSQQISFNDVEEHERECIFRKISCPISHCAYRNNSYKLYQHFTTGHPECLIDNNQIVLDLSTSQNQVFLMYENDVIIIVKYRFSAETRSLQFCVYPIFEKGTRFAKYKLQIIEASDFDGSITFTSKPWHKEFLDYSTESFASIFNNPKMVYIKIFLLFSDNAFEYETDEAASVVKINADLENKAELSVMEQICQLCHEFTVICQCDLHAFSNIIPCQWKGCSEEGDRTTMLTHNDECKFKLQICPFLEDCEEGLFKFDSRFISHLETHAQLLPDHKNILIPLYHSNIYCTKEKTFMYFTVIDNVIVKIVCTFHQGMGNFMRDWIHQREKRRQNKLYLFH
ncbi:hypothetical protein FQR65_LT05662 [Abscondita terminalis]|nr:hypothetical protein FQR65_LT05662 [Abscondita terminalis]